MSTSDLGAPTGAVDELTRLAAEVLGQLAAAGVAPRSGFDPLPSAAHVGAGGVSGAQTLPPVPGPLQTMPLANAPAPKESDLRNPPTSAAAMVGLPSPVLTFPLAPPHVGGSTPYFLDIAGPARGGADGQPFATPAPSPDVARGQMPPDLGRVVQEFQPTLAPSAVAPGRSLFDAASVKREFPILHQTVNGHPLVWLDNAATTQKPRAVIDAVSRYYERDNSNVHRAAHALAARATDAYEGARARVAGLLGASSPQEIVFTRGATEAINLVAKSWGRKNIGAGDEILITWLEHHANIVPWQQLCSEVGARLCVVPVDDRGQVLLEEYERRLSSRTKLVSVTQVSNALGTIVPVAEMTAMAHRHGARVLVDGAQAVSHMRVDVRALDCDFYCFSGHKVFAPMGIGALYGKPDVLDAMPPWQGGGNMIADVTFERTTYQKAPWRFEAGTGSIGDAVGLGAAVEWLQSLGLDNVARHEHELLVYGTEQLRRVPRLRMIGTAPDKAGVLSFVVGDIPTETIGRALDADGIAVRSGHHCAQPILRRYGLESTVRASLAPYNTREDLDALVRTLLRLTSGAHV